MVCSSCGREFEGVQRLSLKVSDKENDANGGGDFYSASMCKRCLAAYVATIMELNAEESEG